MKQFSPNGWREKRKENTFEFPIDKMDPEDVKKLEDMIDEARRFAEEVQNNKKKK